MSQTSPLVVVQLINEQVAKVKELTGMLKERNVHTSRLKLYSDSSLNITEDLLHHIEYEQQALYVVERFIDIKESRNGLQIKTLWLGFEEDEATWESFEVMVQDVPALVAEYLDTSQVSDSLKSKGRRLLAEASQK